jgi:hypothetical protein
MRRKSARRKRLERRIVDAVRRAVGLGYEPKSLYLKPEDMREMIRWSDDPVTVDGMPLRLGKHSALYCKHGTSVHV